MTWQTKLVRWYRRNRRDLPWRRTKDPYRIWVSEIMLQQTTVEAVIPFYRRFLRRFPTVSRLATASEEEVLALWSGLGYYSRARNLHRAARSVAANGGRLPATAEELERLPGIGRYTAGAIASIAFGESAPIVDGNVIRVLSRLFALSADPTTPGGRKQFWQMASEVLPEKNAGDFNQSLMELGATICLPRNLLCPLCPISSSCKARRKESAESFPKGGRKISCREEIWTVGVVWRNGKLLFIRRPEHGLLKKMWEFPTVIGSLAELKNRFPLKPADPLPQLRHSILNRRLRVQPVLCRMIRPLPADLAARWVTPAEAACLPASSLYAKILRRMALKDPRNSL